MSTVDVYRITDQLDDLTLDALIARLEARGKHPHFIAMMHEYLEAIPIDSARSVLDLGCGTGVVARAIADRKTFTGRITGIDRSSYLIDAAAKFAEQEGLGSTVAFIAGDSHSLNLPSAAFDAVVAHTLLSHVEDPAVVLKEIARLLKPGGKVGIFDGDFASFTYGIDDDPAKAKAVAEAIVQAVATNPTVMREMPKLLRASGLALEAAFSHVVADIGKADFFAPGLQSFVTVLPKSGAMTAREARDWVDMMMKQSDEGVYFGSANFYSYVATRR
ncbi:MAG: methyltransferase domain-containing protein [Betaproteobacteria bacterium]